MGVLGDVCCVFWKVFHAKCGKCRDMYDLAGCLGTHSSKSIKSVKGDEAYENI